MFDNLPSSLPHIKAGKLRALAVTSLDARAGAARCADRRRVGAAGIRGVVVVRRPRAGRHAAATRHQDQRRGREVARHHPKRRKSSRAQGANAAGGTPEDFARTSQAETAKWAKVVKESGAQGGLTVELLRRPPLQQPASARVAARLRPATQRPVAREHQPRGEECDAADRRANAEACGAAERQRIEAPGEQHDAGDEQPRRARKPRELSGHCVISTPTPSRPSACQAWYCTAVCQIARSFGCEPRLERVRAERAQRDSDDIRSAAQTSASRGDMFVYNDGSSGCPLLSRIAP